MLDRREHGRQRILEGAAHILDAGLLDDFTVDSLARNLRMSKSTLYKYFDSKDQVVIALVEAACRDTMRSLESLDLAGKATVIEALDSIVEVLADKHLLLVKGSVPGAKNGLLMVRRAVKAPK